MNNQAFTLTLLQARALVGHVNKALHVADIAVGLARPHETQRATDRKDIEAAADAIDIVEEQLRAAVAMREGGNP